MTVKLFDLLHNSKTNEDIRILHMTSDYAVVARTNNPRKLGIYTIGRKSIQSQLTQCMKNLVEEKPPIFESYGLSLATTKSGLTLNDVMPVNVKPHILRVDHGSDFISKEAQRIAKENNIQIDYVTPATGSYKSIVERSL